MRRVVKSADLPPQAMVQDMRQDRRGVFKSPLVQVEQRHVVIGNKPAIAPQKPKEQESEKPQIDCADIEKARLQLDAFEKQLHVEAEKIIGRAQSEAQGIVVEGKVKAEGIVSKAKRESAELLEKAKADGYAEGFAKGHAEGQTEATAKAQEKLDALTQALSTIDAHKDSIYRAHEQELLKLMLDTTEKIVLQSMEADENRILAMLQKAAKGFRNADFLRITVSDMDISAEVAGDLEKLRELVGDIPHIEVERLREVDRGTLIVDNGSELVDASVSTQLNMLREIASKNRTKKIEESEQD